MLARYQFNAQHRKPLVHTNNVKPINSKQQVKKTPITSTNNGSGDEKLEENDV